MAWAELLIREWVYTEIGMSKLAPFCSTLTDLFISSLSELQPLTLKSHYFIPFLCCLLYPEFLRLPLSTTWQRFLISP